MSITWGEIKAEILLGVLKDKEETKYAEAELLTWAKWACTELAFHTAEAATKSYVGDGQAFRFALPDSMVDGIEKSGLVGFNDSQRIVMIQSNRQTPGVTYPTIYPTSTNALKGKCYWEWPTGHLTLSFVPQIGQTIEVQFFKVWDIPKTDASILNFPHWMHQPFSLLMGANAMGPKGVSASDIRQWNRKNDSGNPEHNPLHRQAEFFQKQADRIMSKVTPQDRENFYQIRGGEWKSQ